VLETVTDKLADPEEFLARVRDLYGKKHEKSHEEVHFKDGRVIERYSAPMWGENNRYYGRVWYFRDITERKQAEEEIRSAAIWWQRTFDAITDPIFIFEREGTILRSNIAASHILGIPLDQIVGRKCHEIVHGTSEFIPGCPYVTMLKSGVSESYTLQWNDRWFKVTTHPLYDDKGTITKAIHVMTDIDLIKRAAEERARLAAIIDSSQDAIISITLDGSIASWNESAERMFDHTGDQVIGKHYNAILTDESAPAWEEAFSTLLKGESVRHGETVLLARGRKTFDASFSLSPVRDDAGELSGIAAIIRDLSEQRKAERDLVAFVTEAALRLKNPVEIIREDLADLLRRVDSDTFSGPEISLLLHVQIRNASQILENLQALNKAIVEGHEEIPRAYREFLSG
jgi:PAS domain S-box-containing protein